MYMLSSLCYYLVCITLLDFILYTIASVCPPERVLQLMHPVVYMVDT